MKKLTARFSNVFIAICLAAISLAAQTSVGFVLEIEGNWVLNGSNALSPGEKLPVGGSIRRQSASPDDRITIADMRGAVLDRQDCENGDCSGVIRLPRKAPSNSLADTVVGSIMEWLRTSPRRKDLSQSRNDGLSEDVLKTTDGSIDLSSVSKTQGEQYLRWRVISLKEDDAAVWTKPVKLDETAIVTGFQPGLYEINLMRSNGTDFEPVAAAWILAATPAEYEKTRASFQEVREISKKWGEKVKPETTRLFLQAALSTIWREKS